MAPRHWIVVAVLLAIPASSLVAQPPQSALRVRIETDSRVALAGALVALIDSGDRVASEELSSAAGTAVLAAAAGSYRIRVRRIGYRPFYSEPVALPHASELVLRVESPRVVLNAMVVSVTAQCGQVGRDAETLATLWEEISKALRASQLTTNDLRGVAGIRTYRRELRPNDEVISSDSLFSVVWNRRPFGSPDPNTLVSAGYVRGDEVRGWEYYGPDEAVLLSDGFAATHCFRSVRHRNRPGQIGVAFEPAPKRKRSDIQGVLWLDEASSELREIRFQFVNAGILSRFEPGGFTRFHRMPSGAWIVSEWQLRMPQLEYRLGPVPTTAVTGYIVNGGEVVLSGR